ncbi:MAG: hypothetical protein D6702_01540 [Planctomycetota bacterium]|nr:MAG: hypothetical protein D6702_01540 [Planctomycetota bacterium]
MTHIEIAHGLRPPEALAFEARLREARIPFLKEAGSLRHHDPFPAAAGMELEPEPCTRFRVRAEHAAAARAILARMMEERVAGAH